MMFGKIKYIFLESCSLFKLHESMKVLGAILVILLSNNILHDSMLLLEVLEGRLRGDLTLGIREKPTLGDSLICD